MSINDPAPATITFPPASTAEPVLPVQVCGGAFTGEKELPLDVRALESRLMAGRAGSGSIVNVSVWDCDAHAAQMNNLREMVVDARGEMEALGVTFIPIVNYPISWTI